MSGPARAPRRKVVKVFPIPTSINMFNCTLTCGHVAPAYGMVKPGEPEWAQKHPPKSVSCRRCAKPK